MGRRKIEIQPITRKNGLFKKAYELGVLCSVDVAVIIFEERSGHPVKLYQYCSSNIDDLVSRHQQHEGERDTRGPADFAGNAATKHEAEEDDIEEEDDIFQKRKRTSDGRIKTSSGYSDVTLGGDAAYGIRSQNPLSQSTGVMPLHNTGGHSPLRGGHLQALGGSALSRRPRIPTISTQSRQEPETGRNPNSTSSVSASYDYHSPSSASPFRPPAHQASTSSSFGMGISGDSFSNSSRSSQPPTRNVGSGGGGGSYPPRPSSSGYDAAGIYNPSMRHSHNSASGGSGGNNLFNFLDQDSPHGRSQTSGSFPGLDWPVHGSSNSSQHSGRRET
ncbi:hypothetical protein AAF712_014821 [Marasmius tenuissimus]|uniref:MADS-box domain-containing protein n=1 Tax=Marasmius tenuissimus TaxID=585030 RepID=A0ABR2ZB91_9AGAR